MNKEIRFKFDWLLWFLILLPTFYIVNKDIRHIQMNFFQISVILMVAALHINRWFGLFLAWATFQTMFFSDVPEKSVILQNICFSAVLYHFIVKYVGEFRRYFWAFVGILLVNVLLSVCQMNQFDPIYSLSDSVFMQKHDMRLIFSEYPGFFGIPSFFGNFAAVILPLCVLINPLLSIFAIFGIIVSKSSFSMMAGGFSILFFLWFRKRILFWVFLLFFVVAGSAYIVKYDSPTGQFSRRFVVWRMALTESFKSQFFGNGIGSYGSKYFYFETTPNQMLTLIKSDDEAVNFIRYSAENMGKSEIVKKIDEARGSVIDMDKLRSFARDRKMDFEAWNSLHNEFLQTFFDMGLIGVAILFGFIGNILKRFFLVKNKDMELVALMSSFIAILVVSFAHFPFHVARLGGPFIVLIALLETKLLRNENAYPN